jgi:cellulose synthase/poly-beta-1,6-N-acetylglucosamine synthase-like glycosyltransferase
VKYAKGEICAFIDSDARPEKNWLKNALPYLSDPEVVAVGGPGLTPPEDSLI